MDEDEPRDIIHRFNRHDLWLTSRALRELAKFNREAADNPPENVGVDAETIARWRADADRADALSQELSDLAIRNTMVVAF